MCVILTHHSWLIFNLLKKPPFFAINLLDRAFLYPVFWTCRHCRVHVMLLNCFLVMMYHEMSLLIMDTEWAFYSLLYLSITVFVWLWLLLFSCARMKIPIERYFMILSPCYFCWWFIFCLQKESLWWHNDDSFKIQRSTARAHPLIRLVRL